MPQFLDYTSISGPLRMKFVNFYCKNVLQVSSFLKNVCGRAMALTLESVLQVRSGHTCVWDHSHVIREREYSVF
jgi:hypothetical protein